MYNILKEAYIINGIFIFMFTIIVLDRPSFTIIVLMYMTYCQLIVFFRYVLKKLDISLL